MFSTVLKFLWVLYVIFWSLTFSLLIWLEDVFSGCFLLPFPRDWNEVFTYPKLVEKALKRGFKRTGKGLPENATIVKIEFLSPLNGEPKKNATSRGITITYTLPSDTTQYTLRLFIKFQSGRDFPLLLQGCRAAVEPGVVREMNFYRDVSPHAPFKVAQVYAAEALTCVNRVFIALEYFDPASYMTVTDGCERNNLDLVTLMVKQVAPLHSHYVGHTEAKELSWIPEKRGLEFVNYIKGLRGPMPGWYSRILNALHDYFEDLPVTFLHGDCRPGNQIFDRELKNVIFSDFEATTIGPLLWDFTYCLVLGLEPEIREANLHSLLALYQKNFSQNLISSPRNCGLTSPKSVAGSVSRGSIVSISMPRVSMGAGVSISLVSPRVATKLKVSVNVNSPSNASSVNGPNSPNNGQKDSEEILHFRLLSLVLFYVSELIMAKKFWDGHGNTRADHEAWESRVLDATLKAATPEVMKALQISEQDRIDLIEFAKNGVSKKPVEQKESTEQQAPEIVIQMDTIENNYVPATETSTTSARENEGGDVVINATETSTTSARENEAGDVVINIPSTA